MPEHRDIPTAKQRDWARQIARKWIDGLSVATREYVSNHDITMLQENIAYAAMRAGLDPTTPEPK